MTPDDLEVLRSSSAHVVVDDVEFVELDDDAVHHVFRVLRVRDGEIVTVTDGFGGWRVCRAVGQVLEMHRLVVAVVEHQQIGVTLGQLE